MIKINLLGEESVSDQSGKIAIAMYLGSIALLCLVFYFVQSTLSGQVEELNAKTQNLENELARVEKITREVKELEKKKDEFNSKLLVIAMLKKNKLGPVRVLDDLNNAMPEKAWLTDIKEKEGSFTIAGRSLDEQTFSAFIRELGKSDYFGEQSNQNIKKYEKDGVTIKEFSFDTRIFYGGKLAAEQAAEIQAAQGDGKGTDPKAGKKG